MLNLQRMSLFIAVVDSGSFHGRRRRIGPNKSGSEF